MLEHVDDPSASLAALARYLAPGGCAYLTIPNFKNPGWVRSDPHFKIAGITLLPPPLARTLAYAVHPWLPRYSVGEYHCLPWYRQQLADLGLKAWLLNPPAGELREVARNLRSEATGLMDAARGSADSDIPPELARTTNEAIVDWADTLLREVSPDSPDPAVLDDYAVQTWELLAVSG